MSPELQVDSRSEVSANPASDVGVRARLHAAMDVVAKRKDFAATIQSVATVIALVAGGLWTYALTKQYRETIPRLSITHEVTSWRLADDSILVRVDSKVTNVGKVLVKGLNGNLVFLRLLPETEGQRREYANGKIFFDCQQGRPDPIDGCIPEQGLNIPAESKKAFEISDGDRNLEPSESENYWRYWHLDGAAQVVEVQTFIEYPDSRGKRGWTTDTTHVLKPSSTDAMPPQRSLSLGNSRLDGKKP